MVRAQLICAGMVRAQLICAGMVRVGTADPRWDG
jgi:hypothetical protein